MPHRGKAGIKYDARLSYSDAGIEVKFIPT